MTVLVAATTPSGATRPHRLLLPGLIFACLVAAIISSLGAPLVPAIAGIDHVSLTTAQWSLTITLLAGAVATPTMGRLGDGPYRREVIVGALAVVMLGCALAALPLGFGALLVGRALQGMGLGLTPLAIGTARAALPAGRARRAVALLSITTVTGVGLGYPITGLVAEAGGVHVAYWFGTAVTAVALFGAIRVVPSARHQPRTRLDVVGAVLLGLALAGLLLGISEGETWGWMSARTLGLIVGAVVLFTGWVGQELRVEHPLVALRLMRHRSVLTANVTALLAGVGMYLLISLMIRYVQTPASVSYGFGASVVVGGLALLPFSLGSYLATRLTPALTRRISHASVLPLASLVLLGAMLVFSFARSSMWEVLVMMAIAGLGVGGIFAVVPGMLMRSVSAEETSSAMSFNQVLRYIGYATGSALCGVVLEAHTATGQLYPTDRGYTVAGLIACGMWVLSAIVSLLVGRSGRQADPLPEDELLAEQSLADAEPSVAVEPSAQRTS